MSEIPLCATGTVPHDIELDHYLVNVESPKVVVRIGAFGLSLQFDSPDTVGRLATEFESAARTLYEALGYPTCENCLERVPRVWPTEVTVDVDLGSASTGETHTADLCADCAGIPDDERETVPVNDEGQRAIDEAA